MPEPYSADTADAVIANTPNALASLKAGSGAEAGARLISVIVPPASSRHGEPCASLEESEPPRRRATARLGCKLSPRRGLRCNSPGWLRLPDVRNAPRTQEDAACAGAICGAKLTT